MTVVARTIRVSVPGGAYSVTIAPGLLAGAGSAVREVAPGRNAFAVVDERIHLTHGAATIASLGSAGFDVSSATIRALEEEKALDVVRSLYDRFLAARLDRSSAIVAVGGGVIGDIAGFAAATFLRGVPLVQVPTTLLAMVDAAIGGKTGVNHPLPGGERLGKNLIGAFWQPRAVIADPRVLATLDVRDLRCGLAECLKHAMIADAALLDWIESRACAIEQRDEDVLSDLIERSARIKVAIVESDEREAGPRALLNLGHTFAHAIEPIVALDLRHGEAVAIGVCAAAHCARATQRLAAAGASRITALVEKLGLPARLPRPWAAADLIEAMGYDKKVAASGIRLVLPVGIGKAEIVSGLDRGVIESAWRAVGAT